jgi:hypothetical protein
LVLRSYVKNLKALAKYLQLLIHYLGAIEGPPDLSGTVDQTIYGTGRSR